MEYPDVTVIEVTLEKDMLVTSQFEKDVDLGAIDLSSVLVEDQYNNLKDRFRKESTRIFLLTWEGGKVPRKAKIFDFEIAWTQHGIVRIKNGEDIGTYDRIVEFGGESEKEQKMIVYLYPSVVKVVEATATN